MAIRELKSLHTKQSSFYGKAFIEEIIDDRGITGIMNLRSYGNIACQIEFGHTLRVTIPTYASKTTKRHVREFLMQNFDVCTCNRILTGYENGKRWWDYPINN